MNKEYIVYKHIFPNNKVYIGITSQKPERRWNNGNGYRKSTRIYNAIKKYGWKNIEHIILYENLSKEEAEIKEKELIKKYKSYDFKYGYNLELGGNINKEISEETKKKISKKVSGKNNPMYGVRLPESILEKKRKKVLCIETGIIYNSLTEASKKENINISCLSEACNGKQKISKGCHWRYL